MKRYNITNLTVLIKSSVAYPIEHGFESDFDFLFVKFKFFFSALFLHLAFI